MSQQRGRRRTRSPEPVPGAPHGTSAGYQTFRCGCDDCSAWKRDSMARYLAGPAGRRLVLQAKLVRRERAAESARAAVNSTKAEINDIDGLK